MKTHLQDLEQNQKTYHARRKLKRLRAAEKQNWQCHWCGHMMCRVDGCQHRVTLDHVVPRHNGGTLRPGNFVAACFKCNSERHPEVNRMKKRSTNLVATTGEPPTESPFAVLKGAIT
jgi:5-methylcytosine-specific restriction endonuclease McrA